MNHQGHGLALQHPIFNRPNKATFPTATAKRGRHQEGYTSPLYPEGMDETYEVVDFEIGPPDGWNPTLVSHEGFFTDVPGFENLAEGVSAKMLGSLSLARQGRYFYWGYSIDPDRLTEPAEATLVNVIHYMAGKRGHTTTPYQCKTRRTLWVYLALNQESGYLRGIEEHFIGSVKEDSRLDYVPTPQGLENWLNENKDFLFSGKDASHRGERYKTIFEVDVEAKSLGTPNYKRESLEKWLEMASSEDEDARVIGRNLLERYVHPTIAPLNWDSPSDWYSPIKDRIVFVDSAGFWWMTPPPESIPVSK